MTSRVKGELTPEKLAEMLGVSLDQARELIALEQKDVKREIGLQIFQLANKYLESAAALNKHIEESKNANVLPGHIMCLSMALELYFKALVVLDYSTVFHYQDLPSEVRSKLGSHKIPVLFDLIDDRHRDRLADVFGARMGVPRLTIPEFRSQLVEKANDIFVEWRYVYENEPGTTLHLNLVPVHNLITAAQLVAVEAKRKVEA